MNRWLLVAGAGFMGVVLVLNIVILTFVLHTASNINALLLNGHTQAAETAKATKADVVKGDAIVAKLERQLSGIAAKSETDRALICSVAKVVGISSTVIRAGCP